MFGSRFRVRPRAPRGEAGGGAAGASPQRPAAAGDAAMDGTGRAAVTVSQRRPAARCRSRSCCIVERGTHADLSKTIRNEDRSWTPERPTRRRVQAGNRPTRQRLCSHITRDGSRPNRLLRSAAGSFQPGTPGTHRWCVWHRVANPFRPRCHTTRTIRPWHSRAPPEFRELGETSAAAGGPPGCAGARGAACRRAAAGALAWNSSTRPTHEHMVSCAAHVPRHAPEARAAVGQAGERLAWTSHSTCVPAWGGLEMHGQLQLAVAGARSP